MKKALVVFFSHTGNTKKVAMAIQQMVGGDLAEIVPKTAYPATYEVVLPIARREFELGILPEILPLGVDLDAYEVIFLGYPIWWVTMPMAVHRFLVDYDLGGRVVIPFCTHEGSGLKDTVEDIVYYCPEVTIRDGFALQGAKVFDAERQIEAWLARVMPAG